ncbi:MAG: hypothetical protein ACI9MR_003647 [Myxococcota bacterium]|jgi:hypothetical protein
MNEMCECNAGIGSWEWNPTTFVGTCTSQDQLDCESSGGTWDQPGMMCTCEPGYD